MSKKTNNQTAKVNWPITILLIIGCLTVFFPLYMAVIIAFKQPSEMTNDIAGKTSGGYLQNSIGRYSVNRMNNLFDDYNKQEH